MCWLKIEALKVASSVQKIISMLYIIQEDLGTNPQIEIINPEQIMARLLLIINNCSINFHP